MITRGALLRSPAVIGHTQAMKQHLAHKPIMVETSHGSGDNSAAAAAAAAANARVAAMEVRKLLRHAPMST